MSALRIAQDKGYVENIGFSIYAPEILDDLTKALWPDIIQAPLNVFDQRISLSGWLDRLVDGGVEIHTRSAFLQGLLLMPAVKRPSYFNDWKDHLARWDELVASKADSPMALRLIMWLRIGVLIGWLSALTTVASSSLSILR